MSDVAGQPAFPSREIRLWWPIPLAVIIWLAIIWKFGSFLSSPKVEMAASAPIEASFVELPEAAPSKSPDIQPKSLSRPDKPKIKPRHAASSSTDMAAAKPEAQAVSPPEPDLAPLTDMLSYVNAARARRHAAESSAARENAAATASERGPSSDEVRMANIRRNLQPQGTNGVFQIVSLSVRTGKFLFRGWTTGSSNARQETIEVDAGPNGDLERAMVRSMIELIRKYYKGDFNWESQRLDRVIVLSARLEDNAGLEDFLIQEFFGAKVRLPGPVSRNGYR